MDKDVYKELLNGNILKVINDFIDDPEHTTEDCTLVTVLYSLIMQLVAENSALTMEIKLLARELMYDDEEEEGASEDPKKLYSQFTNTRKYDTI